MSYSMPHSQSRILDPISWDCKESLLSANMDKHM